MNLLMGFGFHRINLEGQCVINQVAYSDQIPSERKTKMILLQSLQVPQNWFWNLYSSQITRISIEILTIQEHSIVYWEDSGNLIHSKNQIPWQAFFEHQNWKFLKGVRTARSALLIKSWPFLPYGELLQHYPFSLMRIGRKFFQIREAFSRSLKTCKSLQKSEMLKAGINGE